MTKIDQRFLLEEEEIEMDKKYLESEKFIERSYSFPTISTTSKENEEEKKLTQHDHSDDWNASIHLIVNQMIQNVNSNGVLLIDSINDCTNGSLDFRKAIIVLRNAVEKSGIFTLISEKQLAIVKKKLGILPKDKFSSPSKAIGIARSVGAHYVLYSSAKGRSNAPILQMQLILVQTGEIIWSSKTKLW